MLNPPEIEDSSKLADWAELCLMFGDDISISKSEFIAAFEEDMKQNVENIITIIWHEVYWRKKIAPDSYPIEINVSNIERKSDWEEAICYCFMTLLSAQSFIPEIKVKPAEWTATAKLFERVTESALKEYIGETIIMGAPRNEKVPTNFDESVTYLCEKIREERGKNPCSKERTRDDGLDVTAWCPIDDRSNKIIVLAQCASGADWENKTKDLDIGIWNTYVDWPVIPLRAFAFPHINNTRWRRLSIEGGLLFDRLRLSKLGENRLSKELRKELKKWIKDKMDNLPIIDY